MISATTITMRLTGTEEDTFAQHRSYPCPSNESDMIFVKMFTLWTNHILPVIV